MLRLLCLHCLLCFALFLSVRFYAGARWRVLSRHVRARAGMRWHCARGVPVESVFSAVFAVFSVVSAPSFALSLHVIVHVRFTCVLEVFPHCEYEYAHER